MPEPLVSDKHDAHRRLVARLLQQSDDVKRLSSGLDEAGLSTRPIPGKWSLKELVCHLLRTQQVFEARMDAMLAADNAKLSPYDPEHDPVFNAMLTRPGAQIIAEFETQRRRFADRLTMLSPTEWHRAGQHPDYAQYDVHFAIEYLAHHEAHHLYQMFERRAMLGRIPH